MLLQDLELSEYSRALELGIIVMEQNSYSINFKSNFILIIASLDLFVPKYFLELKLNSTKIKLV